MSEYKELLGATGMILGMLGYIPYVRNILRGKTKPHAFSWFIWSVLTGIAFFIQWSEGAGAGSWVTGATSALCLFVFFLAIIKGSKTFPPFDWIVLSIAVFAIVLWQTIDDPTISIFVVTVIDAFAYVPTLIKAFHKPFEETAILFGLDVIKWIFALLAMETLVFATWFYPATLIIVSGLVVAMILLRRNMLR